MQFAFVTIYVRNMEESLRFYNDYMGLPIQTRHGAGNGEMAMLGEEGQPMIELLYDPDLPEKPYHGFSVGIQVDSLDDAVKDLEKKGYPVIRGPIAPNPHVRFSFVHDDNGVEVELIEYVE